MGRNLHFFCVASFLWIASVSHAQTEAEVRVHPVQYADRIVHIYFDIIDGEAEDVYTVELLITDSLGKVMDAKALNGDIGEGVAGGNNKHIRWDPARDLIYINAKISFEVRAYRMEETENSIAVQSYNRFGLLAQSILIPGLGMTKVTGKPHWLRAVAGYGCIGTSLFFCQQARKSYKSLPDYPEFEDKTEVYNTAINQDQLSEAFAYAAIGVWVTDILWTLVATRTYPKGPSSGSTRGLSFRGMVDSQLGIQGFTFTYSF